MTGVYSSLSPPAETAFFRRATRALRAVVSEELTQPFIIRYDIDIRQVGENGAELCFVRRFTVTMSYHAGLLNH